MLFKSVVNRSCEWGEAFDYIYLVIIFITEITSPISILHGSLTLLS